MASQARVQEYLQSHKIGTLFEGLMAKLIKDQPDQPISYLIGVLQIKAERAGERARRSGSPVRSRGRSPDPLTKSMPSAFAATDSLAVAKDRSYDKPWKTNSMRNTKGSTEKGSPTRKSKAEWDSKVKVTELDDIWGDAKILGKTRTGKTLQSPSPTRAGQPSWGTGDDEEDLAYISYGYSGPRRSRREEEDPLAGEFSVGKPEKAKKSTESKISHGKMKGQKVDAMKHKKNLEKKILQMKQAQHDSGIEEERDLVQDNAIELMEDVNELRKEGCWNVKKSGIRISKNQRSGRQDADSQVRVSICAHCAKVMTGATGAMPSVPGDGGFELPDCDYDTDRAFDSRPASARFTPSPGALEDDEDEEFESVSQVTGPRRVPAWQQKDPEVTTPRKGTHMFRSNMSPSKGRPMYSSGKPKGTKNTRFGTSSMRSDEFASSPEPDMRKTWSPAGKEEFSEDEQAVTSRDSTAADGAGWRVNDYDSDSSTFVGGGTSKKTFQSRAY